MKITVKEIARLVNGKVNGAEDTVIRGLSTLDDASDSSLTFLANIRYIKHIYDTNASAVLVNEDMEFIHEVKTVLIYVKDAYVAFTQLLEILTPSVTDKTGIEQPSFISSSAVLHSNIYVGSFSYIGDKVILSDNVKIYPQVYIGDEAVIGDNSIIYPGVKIYPKVRIGKNCIIHSGCVIGSDGFGFAPMPDGTYKKIPQTGDVVIYDNVEIGANTTVDRATLKSTIINEGVKLDNLIQIAHNVEIGANTVIASQSGVSGSAKVGERCMIGGQVGVIGHVSIANGSIVAAKSGVHKSITIENCTWSGAPLYLHKEAMKLYVLEKNLPELFQKVQELENKIKELSS